MKSTLLLLFAVLLVTACEQPEKQFWTEGPEVDLMRSIEAAYENRNFDAYDDYYVDTAKIYHNSLEPITVAQMKENDREGQKMFSSWAIVSQEGDEPIYEVIRDDEGDVWGGLWGRWEGTLAETGEKIVIPVHISFLIEDGKVTEEWGYWNEGPFVEMMMMQEMEKMKSDTTDM